MDHYLDIRLRPDPEIAAHQLLCVLFTKFHHALVRAQHPKIGVSFPLASVDDEARASRTLGQVLRLHGTRLALGQLMEIPWMQGLNDHVNVGGIGLVPTNAKHRVVSRVQAKSSPERLRRRFQKRHGVGAAEARERIPDSAGKTLSLPFVTLHSTSTSQSFHLFVKHGELQDAAVLGDFTSYGLSSKATVPWF